MKWLSIVTVISILTIVLASASIYGSDVETTQTAIAQPDFASTLKEAEQEVADAGVGAIAQPDLASTLKELDCISGRLEYAVPPVFGGQQEISYDDGSAENSWTVTDTGLGCVFAVCFTPPTDCPMLKTARFFFSDFGPTGPIVIHVYEQASASSPPGAELITPFTVTPPGPGWFDVDLSGYNIVLDGSSFAIGEEPTVPYTSYLGEDTDSPDYRSWVYMVTSGTWLNWANDISPGDLMIRAIVEGGLCCVETAVYQAGVPDPEGILNPLRALRDDNLKEEDVDRYYDYSNELTMVMTKDPALADEAARLLVKYSPMVEDHVTGTGEVKLITGRDVKDEKGIVSLRPSKGKVKLITGRDVEEVVSFTDGLKRSVSKNRGEIGAERSQGILEFLDDFKEQVEASEGKTFSEALQSSIYFESD